MKKKVLIILLIIVVVFFGGIYVFKNFIYQPNPFVCKLLGGEATSYNMGIGSFSACGFGRAPDAGKICYSSDECYYNCTELGDVIGGVIGYCESYDYWRSAFYTKQDYQGIQVESSRQNFSKEQLDKSYQDYLQMKEYIESQLYK